MKLQKFTTEDTEKKRFIKNSVPSEFASSPREYPLKEVTKRTMRAHRWGGKQLSRNLLYLNLFSVFSVANS